MREHLVQPLLSIVYNLSSHSTNGGDNGANYGHFLKLGDVVMSKLDQHQVGNGEVTYRVNKIGRSS